MNTTQIQRITNECACHKHNYEYRTNYKKPALTRLPKPTSAVFVPCDLLIAKQIGFQDAWWNISLWSLIVLAASVFEILWEKTQTIRQTLVQSPPHDCHWRDQIQRLTDNRSFTCSQGTVHHVYCTMSKCCTETHWPPLKGGLCPGQDEAPTSQSEDRRASIVPVQGALKFDGFTTSWLPVVLGSGVGHTKCPVFSYLKAISSNQHNRHMFLWNSDTITHVHQH